jgi:hypothetical protein
MLLLGARRRLCPFGAVTRNSRNAPAWISNVVASDMRSKQPHRSAPYPPKLTEMSGEYHAIGRGAGRNFWGSLFSERGGRSNFSARSSKKPTKKRIFFGRIISLYQWLARKTPENGTSLSSGGNPLSEFPSWPIIGPLRAAFRRCRRPFQVQKTRQLQRDSRKVPDAHSRPCRAVSRSGADPAALACR